MAIEYVLYGDTDVTAGELTELLAEAIEADRIDGTTAFRDDMYVSVVRVSGDEATEERPGDAAGLFGFEHRVTATFRLADPPEPHNTALMVAAVLAYFDRYGDCGVLLYNGYRAVLQLLPDGVVFDSGWEQFTANDEVAALRGGNPARPLPQPML